MNGNGRRAAIAGRICAAAAIACAAFMLAVLPLLFHDALFDINRFKVAAVRAVVPPLCVLALLARLAQGVRPRLDAGVRRIAAPCALTLLFALACVASGAMAGFEHAVLYGDEGRYAGLLFMLCCCAAFLLIALALPGGRIHGALCLAICACGALCGALGAVNTAGYDPLGFYARIQSGQERIFVSTIGHVDFFGTYLLMPFALCGGLCLFTKRRGVRALCAVFVLVMEMGLSSAHTDSAVMGESLACFALLMLSGGSLRRMAGALSLWGCGFIGHVCAYTLAQRSAYHPVYDGVPLLFSGKLSLACAALLFALALLCLLLDRRGARAPGQRRLFRVCAALFLAALLLLLTAIFVFTVVLPDAPIGSAAGMLRFNDAWGSLRGFAYIRAMRAYADYTPLQKLFGRGMELTRRILTPYVDRPALLHVNVFNDTHCLILQLLLTCGLLGVGAYLGLYAAMLALLARGAKEDPALCGAFAVVFSYMVTIAINVTQPILVASFLSFCALAAARMRHLAALPGRQEEAVL